MDKESNLDFITLGNGICNKCRHILPSRRDESYPRCDAFPGGIPEEILTGEFLHIRPFEGDKGIQFEAIQMMDKDVELKKELDKIRYKEYIEYGNIKIQVRAGQKTLTTIERTYPD